MPARSARPSETADDPAQTFFVLGKDNGVFWQDPPDWALRRVRGARIRQHACSDYPEMQALLDEGIDPRWTDGNPVIFEINTVAVVTQDVKFQGGSARIGGRYLMNGASGDRVFARYLKRNPGLPAFRRANRHFAAAREAASLALPIADAETDRLPVALECRNRTNYYHFMTESLPHLIQFVDSKTPRITFHCRSGTTSPFSRDYVRALFPELADRVRFSTGQTRYDQAQQALNLRHVLYANGDPLITGPLATAADDPAWEMVTSHARRRNMMFESSCDASLRRLNERAAAMLPAGLTDRFPRRIWVSRDNRGDINKRPMAGEDMLWEELRGHGFERVYFEHLSPLEQIAAIRAADSVVSMHGAFFANMMFARPETHFVELGTLQTQRHRWGDFAGNAHAAECAYTTVFVDAAERDPGRLRPISTGLSGVRVGRRAVSLIAGLATEPPPSRQDPAGT